MLRGIEPGVGPCEVRVLKRIPVGGGLGGGSADAGAALLGLDALFDLGLSQADLSGAAAALGSDVAFFLDRESPPRPALVTGLGERVERQARLAGDLVLIMPAMGCPTGAVYRAYDAAPRALREDDVRRMIARAEREGGRADPGVLFNDLAGPALAVAPALAAVRSACAGALGGPVHVSGSGSTLFALAPDGPEQAQRWAHDLERRFPDLRVVPGRLV